MKTALSPKRLLKPEQLRAELAATVKDTGLAKANLRPAVVKVLKAALDEAHAMAERQLIADGDGTRCAESLSLAEDEIIRSLFDLATTRLFPPRGAEERIAVVAVGGYWRGQRAPGCQNHPRLVSPSRPTERGQDIRVFIPFCPW
ncbi:hypothetical protein WDZ92_50605, partial [Nostoc sp. NIES-2111]